MHRVLRIVPLAFLLLAPALRADKAADLDALFGKYAELKQFNGSVLVAENGNVLLKKGYGVANAEWGIPNAADTRHRLGSITKQFTSMLVMQLVDEGKLTLDTKLSEALPWYRKDTGEKVTIRQLLSHTSGIPSYTSQPGFFKNVSRMAFGVREFVEKHCSGDLEFPPGTQWAYDNSGYFLLGAVIEEIEKRPYEASLKARIFDPLGMRSSGYDHAETVLPKRAAGYQKRGFGATAALTNAPFLDMSLPFAAGALYSTVEDLYLWDQALYTGKLLPEPRKRELFTPVLKEYAFGWGVHRLPIGPSGAPRTVIGHDGGINGFSTTEKRVIEDRNLVILLSNAGDDLDDMSAGAFDILYGRKPRPPKRPIGDLLLGTFAEKGADAGLASYRELRKAPDVDHSENALNSFGYQLMGAGKLDAALAVFTVAVEENPESWNAWDSLGEAQAEKGLLSEAIKSYETSVAKNPKNANGVETIKKLKARSK